ncbi:MAG: helix-turn-helix transcriptional regulator [Colwellia sp.]|nr:helix-turn-helix transcriptional regulator [Colwellia sp.]
MITKISIRSFSFTTYTHLHEYHQLVIPIRGSADNYTELGDGRIGPGQCIVFPAKCEHRFVPDEQSSFLVVDMDKLPPSFKNISHPILAISPLMQSFCYYVEKQLEHPIRPELQINMCRLFMTILEEQVFMPRIDPRITKVLEIINKDMTITHSLCVMAGIACLSISQFKNLFKKEMGKTPFQYLLSIRMEKARGLLANTDTPVNIVANDVGYFDVSAFSHRFSVYFGHSPRNSRSQ